MNTKLFSEAMGQLDSPYIMEALVEHKPKPFRVRWWKFHKIAACIAAVVLMALFSFGTAFAVSAEFRQALTSFLFPAYTEHELSEIDEGHRTGSFNLEDTLFTFLEKFNREQLVDGVTVKKDHGFDYVVLHQENNSASVIVECNPPTDKLLVLMEKKDYKETTGLWQVVAYQVIDYKTANDWIGKQP